MLEPVLHPAVPRMALASATRRRLRVAACALAATAAAGCGGDDDSDEPERPAAEAIAPAAPLGDESQAAAALESFLTALAADDAAAACGLLSGQGRRIVEEGALIGSPQGGGDCEDVIVDSYDSPDEDVVAGLDVVAAQRSTDGSLRLQFVNADTPITGAAAAVLRKEDGEWRIDSTGLPRG